MTLHPGFERFAKEIDAAVPGSYQKVYDLMMHVRNEVYRQSGVFLDPEIIMLPPDYHLEDKSPKLKGNVVFPTAQAVE